MFFSYVEEKRQEFKIAGRRDSIRIISFDE